MSISALNKADSRAAQEVATPAISGLPFSILPLTILLLPPFSGILEDLDFNFLLINHPFNKINNMSSTNFIPQVMDVVGENK